MPKEKRGHHRSLGYNTVIFVDPSFDAVCTFTQPDKNDCQFLPAVIYFQYNSTKVYRFVCYLMFYSDTKQLKSDGKPFGLLKQYSMRRTCFLSHANAVPSHHP